MMNDIDLRMVEALCRKLIDEKLNPVPEACCGEWETCQRQCVPLANYWRDMVMRPKATSKVSERGNYIMRVYFEEELRSPTVYSVFAANRNDAIKFLHENLPKIGHGKVVFVEFILRVDDGLSFMTSFWK